MSLVSFRLVSFHVPFTEAIRLIGLNEMYSLTCLSSSTKTNTHNLREITAGLASQRERRESASRESIFTRLRDRKPEMGTKFRYPTSLLSLLQFRSKMTFDKFRGVRDYLARRYERACKMLFLIGDRRMKTFGGTSRGNTKRQTTERDRIVSSPVRA